MGQQLILGQAPARASDGASIIDQTTPGVFTTLRTPGGQLLWPLTAQPTLAVPWTIFGWSISFQGAILALVSPTSGPANGLLGKLFGGLVQQQTTPAPVPPNNQPFSSPPQVALPTIATLWDGSQDPPFPQAQGGSALPTSGYCRTVQLPQPLVLKAGDSLGMGLWLTPSLVANTRIYIYGITYTVNYEV